ncbi:MAG: hypothetical protein WBQ94_27965 [Terracidiphilus sp.]
MPVTQLADIIQPAQFSDYIVENSMVSTAFFQSGVALPNSLMAAELAAGSQTFTIPCWNDVGEFEPNYSSDDPAVFSTAQKLTTTKQSVRKAFMNASWSEMSLASELSGDDALARIQDRVSAYWARQFEKRLVASLRGVLLSNVANNASDMVVDISGLTGTSANFNGSSVIDTCATIGDNIDSFRGIAFHSYVYAEAKKNNEIQWFKPSESALEIATYKNMAIIVDDSLSPAAGVYTTIMFGQGALGWAVAAPRTGFGTEVFRTPNSGNGGGQSTLYSRVELALHPLGFNFTGTTVAGVSPSLAELALAVNWNRSFSQRKSVPLAFLISK